MLSLPGSPLARWRGGKQRVRTGSAHSLCLGLVFPLPLEGLFCVPITPCSRGCTSVTPERTLGAVHPDCSMMCAGSLCVLFVPPW